MTFRIELLPLLVAIAAVSFACRAGGFWLMRFVTITPRVQAGLAAAPLAVMVGIVAPAAARGDVPEWAGLGVIALLMRFTRNDLVAALGGVAIVALLRQIL